MEDVIFAGAATRPAAQLRRSGADHRQFRAPRPGRRSTMPTCSTSCAGSPATPARAYKVNSKDVRARDVQMLFADASTGAHSPALVRQGQIAELINAKPKNRRRILEEAAGISGLYQRRHEAELKLKGTETNLARVDDVVEQLANQLAQLARQARQAAALPRDRGGAAPGRGAVALSPLARGRRGAAGRRPGADRDAPRRRPRPRRAARAAGKARAAGRRRAAAAARGRGHRRRRSCNGCRWRATSLPTRRRQAQERIETLTARIAQLERDIEREEALNRDAGETIERLEWERARACQGQRRP